MSMNIMEKIFFTGAIGSSILFMGAMYFKSPTVEKQDAFNVRQELLKSDDVKILYSTLSLFYLQGFQSKSIESFYKLHDILRIQKPKIVALPISKEDYSEKYAKVMMHPKFREAMDTFQYNLKTRNTEEIEKMTSFDLKNLQKLYLIDQCQKLKKCKVVYCLKNKEHYEQLDESFEKLKKEGKNEGAANSDVAKIQDYTDTLVAQMKPSAKFTLMPEPPFKVIVGLVDPDLMRGLAQKWKEKFKQAYSHQIIEDQEVLEREKIRREAEGKSV